MGNVNDVLIDPIAYLKIIMHTRRFWNDNLSEEQRQLIYGVVSGYVEDGVRYITDYIPLFHSKLELDFEKKHSIFKKIENLIQKLSAREEPDYILGWVRSTTEEYVNPTEADKKNQIYLQTAYNKDAVLIYVLLANLEWDHGIEVRGFIDLISTLDTTSILADLNWDYDETEDLDGLIEMVKDLNLKIGKNKPIIKEYGEVSIRMGRRK